MTHDHGYTQCNDGHPNRLDPLNTIFFQYGQGDRIYSHVSDETHWGGFYNFWHKDQDICGTTDGVNYSPSADFDEQEAHGCIEYPWCASSRAHLRLWYAPHPHYDIVTKWSVTAVHHELLVRPCDWTCLPDHQIDEDWEKWEAHLAGEMATHHNIYPNYYFRSAPFNPQGFYDNGRSTRIGGLHDGSY